MSEHISGVLIGDFVKNRLKIEEDLQERIKELEAEICKLKGKWVDNNIRCSGRSTRLIDIYIQQLYNNPNKWIEIKDHHPTRQADRLLCERVICRLKMEHSSDVFEYDMNSCKIMMLPEGPSFTNNYDSLKLYDSYINIWGENNFSIINNIGETINE